MVVFPRYFDRSLDKALLKETVKQFILCCSDACLINWRNEVLVHQMSETLFVADAKRQGYGNKFDQASLYCNNEVSMGHAIW
jgi:hypothetical protein